MPQRRWLALMLSIAPMLWTPAAHAASVSLGKYPTSDIRINDTITAELSTGDDSSYDPVRECEIVAHHNNGNDRVAYGGSRDQCGHDVGVARPWASFKATPGKYQPGKSYKLQGWAKFASSGFLKDEVTIRIKPMSGMITQSAYTVNYGTNSITVRGRFHDGATHMGVFRGGKEVGRFAISPGSGEAIGDIDVTALKPGEKWTLGVNAALVYSGGVYWQHIQDLTVTRIKHPAPPTPTWISPADNGWYNPRIDSENIQITANAVAGIQRIYMVQRRKDGTDWSSHDITDFTQEANGNVTVPIYGSFIWHEGDYEVWFKVSRLGTDSEPSASRTFRVDTTPPTFDWRGLSAAARTITATGKVTDALSGPSWARVQYKRDTGSTWSDGGRAYVDGDGNFSHSFKVSGNANRPYRYDVRVRGFDKAGNPSAWSETRQIEVQRSYPVAQWIAPEENSTHLGMPTYRVKITDEKTSIKSARITVYYTDRYGRETSGTNNLTEDSAHPGEWIFTPRLSDFNRIKDGSAFRAEIEVINADGDKAKKITRSFNKGVSRPFDEFTLTAPAGLGSIKPGDAFELSLRIKNLGTAEGVRIQVPLPAGLQGNGQIRFDADQSSGAGSGYWRIQDRLSSSWDGKDRGINLTSTRWDETPSMNHNEVVVLKLPVKVSDDASDGPLSVTATIWHLHGQDDRKTATVTLNGKMGQLSDFSLARRNVRDNDASGGFTTGDTFVYRLQGSAPAHTKLDNLALAYALPNGLQPNGQPVFAAHSDLKAGLNAAWDGANQSQLLQGEVSLPAGQTVIVDIPVKIVARTQPGNDIASTVTATASQIATAQSVSDTFTLQTSGFLAPAALSTTLTTVPDNASPHPGDTLHYRVGLEARRWALDGAQLDFVLPAGLAKDPSRALAFAPESHVQQGLSTTWSGRGHLLADGVSLPAGQRLIVLVPIQVRENVKPGLIHSQATARAANVRGTQVVEHLLPIADVPRVDGPLRLEHSVDHQRVKPGAMLTYVTRYTNRSDQPLTDLELYHLVPPHTSLVRADCDTPLPPGLMCSSTATRAAANDADGGNGSGGKTRIHWLLKGKLRPGDSGSVSFIVRVDER
ncbi:hypothetical protein [Pandoraea sp.]|uniref:hypothetical protein n=1 Tax=Pandoraea sp. TaxID=1883445 RepID=UPI00120E06FF|nr:hypothetical protein [Pandoraea sp.]TAL53637.1 MAG: hypothetical protein EPN80_15245 [Pandoraea sp.]TAM14820.1 MAG: hypothetical protein EPN65_19795 [Pandoraea sp.]